MSELKNSKVLEIEIATASVKVHCDECNAEMGNQYGKMTKGSVRADYKDNEDDDYEKSHSFCSKACAIKAMS